MNVFEATTLGSVFGAPGDPNGGIFVGKLFGCSRAKKNKRMLYPTYANSKGKNTRIKNSLNEEHLYNESMQPLTEAELAEMFEVHDKQTAFKGGSFVRIQPKCLAFPYCNQGAPDKPVKLISGSKEGMCEGCREYCNHIAEQVGKTAEWVAEGFRHHTLNKLEEITQADNAKIKQMLAAIQPTIDPVLFDKIQDRVAMAVVDPWITYDDILARIKQLIPQLTIQESVELVDNKPKQNIKEMFSLKVKNLAVNRKKELMEALLSSPVSEQFQATLQAEGFLPLNEELNGMTVAESLTALMEDEDMCSEMFEAVYNESTIKEWLNENFGEEESEEEAPAEEPETEETPEETPAEEPSEEPSVDTEEPASPFGGDDSAEEPSADVTDIQPAEEPAPADGDAATQVAVEGGDELATALEALNAAQGEADPATKFGKLTQAQIALQKALDVATSEMENSVTSADTADCPECEADPAADGIAAIAIQESLEVPAPAPAPKGRGGATRKTLDADFISKVDTFKNEYLDDLKWNSLKTYYQLSPETQPEDIHAYLTPGEDENGIGFVQRITNLQNDPTGINRMVMNLMNPAKRGYLEKFGAKYDPQMLDGLEDLMSDMFNKYQAIQAMLDGSHSPLAGDEEEGPEGDDTGYAKDDFEDEFTANDDDNIAAQAAAAAKTTKLPKADITPDLGDDDEEDDLLALKEEQGLSKEVLSTNAENAKENIAQAKDAEKSQETEDMKIDQMKIDSNDLSAGVVNNLDINYTTEVSDEFKDRVLDQASGEVPSDHANVDHDSTAGETLVANAEDRVEAQKQNYTAVGHEEEKELNSVVSEEIARMKKLFAFDATKLKENKQRQKFDEDKFLTERVQKKKFL